MPANDAPILITGATGHVGANLLHRLVEDGKRVRVLLHRPTNEEALANLPHVEVAEGDVRDPRSLRTAFEGCKQIFHVASMVSTIDGDDEHKRALFDINVVGTRNLLVEAKAAGVERVVVTGSFSAVGYDLEHTSRPVDETMQFYPYHRAMPYERSKVQQEQEVLRAVVEGLDAVIVTSCAVVGGHDYLPSRMGQTICKFANRELHTYVAGGFEFVAARDIVAGHLLGMEKGRAGQKYIIASQFLDFDHIWDLLEEVTGQPRPRFEIPSQAMLPVAEVASFLMTKLAPKRTQLLTPGAIRRLGLRRHADTSKAQTELGFKPTSMKDAFAEAYAFHFGRGAIRHPGARQPTASNGPSKSQTNVHA